MNKQPLWDKYETVLLIAAYVRVTNGFMERIEAVEDLSKKLRTLALSRNIEINDKYRNKAGIALQLGSIEYLMTNGQQGIDHASKIFIEMVNTYKTNSEEFYRILNKAEEAINKAELEQISEIPESNKLIPDIKKISVDDNLENSVTDVPERNLVDFNNIGDLSNTIPKILNFKGKEYQINKWSNLYVRICSKIFSYNVRIMKLLLNNNDYSKPVFAKIMYKNYRYIGNNLYAYVPENNNEIVMYIKYLLNACSININNVQIEYEIIQDEEKKQEITLTDDFTNSFKETSTVIKLKNTHFKDREIFNNDKIENTESSKVNNDGVPILVKEEDDSLSIHENNTIKYEIAEDKIKEYREQFIDYLKKQKYSLVQIMRILSHINEVNNIANNNNIININIYLIDNKQELSRILSLLNKAKYVKYIKEINSLKLYIKYVSNKINNIKTSDIKNTRKSVNKIYNTRDKIINKQKDVSIDNDLKNEFTKILNKDNFNNGYKLNSGMSKRKLRRIYETEYGKKLNIADDMLDGIVESLGKKQGEKVLFSINDSNRLIENINNEIITTLTAGIPAIFVNAIFEKYKNKLSNELKIFNVNDFLYAIKHDTEHDYHTYESTNNVMKIYFYYVKRDYVVYNHIHSFIKEMSEPISLSEIHEKNWYFNADDITKEIKAMDDVAKVNKDMYFYSENMDITYSDKAYLIEVMKKYLDENKFLTAGSLVDLINEECPSILTGTSKFTNIGIRNVISYILRKEFENNGRLITLKGIYMDVYQAYEEFASSRLSFSMNDLNMLKEELDGAEIPWDNMLKICIRVSDSQFIRNDQLHFNVWEIDSFLDDQCGENNDYLSINDITSYAQFPAIEVPWNKYVLESYLLNHSHKYIKYHNSFSSLDVYGGMVKKSSNINSYEDLIVNVLADNENWSTKNDALELIIELGYQKTHKMKKLDELIILAKNMRIMRREK